MIEPCEEVVLSVTDDDGVPVLIEYLIKKAHSKNIPAIVLLQKYIEKCPVSFFNIFKVRIDFIRYF